MQVSKSFSQSVDSSLHVKIVRRLPIRMCGHRAADAKRRNRSFIVVLVSIYVHKSSYKGLQCLLVFEVTDAAGEMKARGR